MNDISKISQKLSNLKSGLTPQEVLRVAHAHLVNGLDQHHLASLMGVNQGRISEAVQAVQYTMDHPKLIYEVAIGKQITVKVGDKI